MISAGILARAQQLDQLGERWRHAS